MNPPPDVPADDAPVPDPTPLFRLVKTTNCEVVDGTWEFHAGAFDNNVDDDMSVVLGDTLEALGRSPDDLPDRTFPDPNRWGVAVLEAGHLQDNEEQEIRRTRTDREPAHGDVHGKKNRNRRRRIKEHAEWVFPPPPPPEE